MEVIAATASFGSVDVNTCRASNGDRPTEMLKKYLSITLAPNRD